MSERDGLTERFEQERHRLLEVAHRLLGSRTEAEAAIQQARRRVSRAGDGVENPGGWLTGVVGRICLDMLRSRRSRSGEPVAQAPADPQEDPPAEPSGAALTAALDALSPAERLAFVLHDIFAVPFAAIAPIVGRSTDATKLLVSRARRRVQEAAPLPPPETRAH